jgi:hypothetical protein
MLVSFFVMMGVAVVAEQAQNPALRHETRAGKQVPDLRKEREGFYGEKWGTRNGVQKTIGVKVEIVATRDINKLYV